MMPSLSDLSSLALCDYWLFDDIMLDLPDQTMKNMYLKLFPES
jgi:hypothetical protein